MRRRGHGLQCFLARGRPCHPATQVTPRAPVGANPEQRLPLQRKSPLKLCSTREQTCLCFWGFGGSCKSALTPWISLFGPFNQILTRNMILVRAEGKMLFSCSPCKRTEPFPGRGRTPTLSPHSDYCSCCSAVTGKRAPPRVALPLRCVAPLLRLPGKQLSQPFTRALLGLPWEEAERTGTSAQGY